MNPIPARIAAAVLLAAFCGVLQAQPVAGRHYQELDPPRPVSSPDRVEVIEFFYYGCPVCYEAEPHVTRWRLRAGASLALRQVPAVFTESSESFARTFYALAALNELARLHWPVYDNHHFDGRQLNEEKNVVEWVARNGVDGERFRALRASAGITAQVQAAKEALRAYDIRGVPTFVVDGRWVTSARMAGGVREMIEVLDHLVAQAASARRK
jgi:protein dithiol oxidoreductase (disulfide-forming)